MLHLQYGVKVNFWIDQVLLFEQLQYFYIKMKEILEIHTIKMFSREQREWDYVFVE